MSKSDAKKLFDEGVKLLSERKYSEALEILNDGLNLTKKK